ncbi:unnamed protein product, partial [Rotaria sordida]
MNSFNREKFTFIYLLIMIYNNIIVQSNVEFQNENDTNILFDIKDELILKRDMRFDGSGMTTELTPYSTESVTLVPIETSFSSTESSTIVFTTETSIPTIATTAFFTIQSTTNITSTTESTITIESIATAESTTSTTTSTTTESTTSTTTSTTTESTTSTTTESTTSTTTESTTSTTTESTTSTTTKSTTSTTTESTTSTTIESTTSTTAESTTSTTIESTTSTTAESTTSTTAESTTSTTTESTTSTTTESTTSTSTTSTITGTYDYSPTTTTTTTIIVTPCDTSTHVQLPNGTCISKPDGQILSVNTLHSNTTNSTVIANALSLYISSITNSNTTLNSTYTLTVNEIDTYLSNISNVNLTINTMDSILIAQPVNQGDNVIVLGASFRSGIGGEVINNLNKETITNSYLSTAAIINDQSLKDITSLNILIIDKPTTHENIDNSTNKTLASSVVVVTVQPSGSTSTSRNISLYFQILPDYQPTIEADYFCSFYDTINSIWNESLCTKPQYNQIFNRYECSCSHFTSFALVWLPKIPLTRYLNAQDIASLIFQSISILCFIVIIIHGLIIRICKPSVSIPARDLLPLISCA